ncbi:MAG: HEPN domain-containing protein [Anaerolineae bacterium]|uniref:HEPN domain-containing protein n=1 Tax=Promineifilum sp. TaxID=2664178 RepID=UPI001DD718EF|nr:HEPN domain-containing protein [Anaerolineales bacterium]MCB8934270.1 HEPN domain-containing protein [Promineifilum sp.]MCO5179681.1 HEPN domain-containing protein [Promineifilum sp.]MCW5846808.1 HEPN domain-containing protein [Anaerolineae bacterium]
MTDELIRPWLERAADDLAVGHLVLNEGFTAHTCFLAHQAFEKVLKAYLIKSRHAYPRSHKLVDLVRECSTYDQALGDLLDNAIVLDQYYIPTRYPDATPGTLPHNLPSLEQAKEALSAAQSAFDLVNALLAG